ncbi:DUF3159 domain-containing protein [Actinotalea sp. AC32]|nr:DUF3159 domain-containing protein [Actinotalea sp. AC32]
MPADARDARSDRAAAGSPPAPADEPAEDVRADAAATGGVRSILGEEFSLVDAVGGVRGLVESVLPGLVFVVVFVATRDLVPSLVAASVAALGAVVLRLAQRTPVTQALSGVLGIAVGVVWALTTGRAEDFFAGGLLVNVAYLVGTAVSALVGWPVVGVLVALLRGETMRWRTDPELSGLRRRYAWATWLWAAMFALRLVVQVPFYLAGDVASLGTAKLAMGLPLFAVVLWLTWLLVGPRATRAEHRDRRPTPPR